MYKIAKIKMGVYKHFKGKYCEVFDLAEHSETGETLVIYRTIDKERYSNDGVVFARPFNIFFSKVDKIKYPNAKQEYRFEYIE